MADPTILTAPDDRAADLKANYEQNKSWAKIGPYETALNPNQEQVFRQWVDQNQIRFDPDQRPNDYDMRGYWKALLENKVEHRDPNDPKAHFPDTFKTPYHESFSRESRYATHMAPRWVDNRLVDRKGNVLFDADIAAADYRGDQ